jgi:hypothetical protein
MRGRHALLLGVAIASMGACGWLDDRVAEGPCSLVVQTVSDANVAEVLEYPYRATMSAATGGVGIGFSGAGWQRTLIQMFGPVSGPSATTGNRWATSWLEEGARINAGEVGWFLEAPGEWEFRLSSGACHHVVTIEVAPASS